MRKIVIVAGAVLVSAVFATPVRAAEPPTWTPCTKLAPSWPQHAGTSAECRTVTVPVDYARPDGRTVEIAVDRIPASDRAHRRGVLVLNPGGPGGTGMAMPEAIRTSRLAELGKYYDLVGFDPRGTGYSAQISCQLSGPGPEPQPGASPKDRLIAKITWKGQGFADCAAKDPDFAHTLTATTIARDVDRVRQALGEEKINYFGVSWGSALGASYRSLFDEHVDKMVIESVLPPGMDLDRFERDRASATERDAHRFAQWMAERDGKFHLGATRDSVLATVFALRDELDAHPRHVDDGQNSYTIDGAWALERAGYPSSYWADAAVALAAVHGGKNPPPVQPASGKGFGWDEARPFGLNRFVEHAVICNDTTGTRDLDQVWRDHAAVNARYPIGATDQPVYAGHCFKWPFAGENPGYRPGRSPLQLVGHSYESVTPYEHAQEMRQRIGGAVLTVRDDAHASLMSLPCGNKLVHFFATGVPVSDSCDGAPVPEPR